MVPTLFGIFSLSTILKFVAKIPLWVCTIQSSESDNIALRSLQFSVILDYTREIDSPIPFGAVNIPFAI